MKRQQKKRERDAATAFEELDGFAEWSEPSAPVWLRELIGDDLFTHVESLNLDYTEVSDAGMERLKRFSQLKEMYLFRTNITDAGLENIKRLNELERLDLGGHPRHRCWRKETSAGIAELHD